MDLLKQYINRKFGIDENKFLEVLIKSPGAEGYILGNLGEEIFKEYANSIGYEALRIKEKPAISIDCWFLFLGGAEGNRTPL